MNLFRAFLFAVMISVAYLAGNQAEAGDKTPTKFTKCSAPISPAESSGHYFSADCSTLYVLPPNIAQVTLTGISPSLQSNFCQTVGSLLSVYDKSAQALSDAVAKAVSTSGSGSIPAVQKCSSERSELALGRALVASLSANVQVITDNVSAIKTQISLCSNSCGYLQLALQTQQSALVQQQQKLSKVKVVTSYLEAETKSCPVTEPTTDVSGDVAKLQTQANATADSYLQIYSHFGTIEGATASMLFETKWQALIASYKSLNPNLDIERMPVEMTLTFTATRSTGASLPAVFSVSVPGLSPELRSSDLINALSDNSSVQIGDSLGGQIVFSALGACAVGLVGTHPVNVSQISPQLVANVTYKYYVQSERKYKVHYNLEELYKRIKSVSSSGGLFRSSYDTSVTNMSASDEVITVDIESDDPKNAFPDTADFILDVKRGVLDRALQQVARATLPRDATTSLPTISAGTPAAPEMAKKLHECPNWYCQAGAIVLDLGSALFGGADASSKYIEQNHISNSESVSDKRMVPEYGGFSFRP